MTTSLVTWLKNANCIATGYPEYGDPVNIGRVTWQQALDFVYGMNNGTYYCRVSQTDWRLPNIREILSLIDYEGVDSIFPVPDGHPFTNLSEPYWSSTTVKARHGESNHAFMVFGNAVALSVNKITSRVPVWPVRGGQ